ncbi:threonylcarbamoyl-AMP synthase-like [Convolutriloba macropyga]|uniref:threonylcarbamoyl-AMP synthase-like n=1 Tax=Convolutriloba macropyga TaxID=536237 RepID=UPI003F527B94
MIITQLTKSALREIASCLRNGGVIAVPTDTIYGVACLAQSSDGIRKIYNLKSRDNQKPLAVLLPDVDTIEKYAVLNDETTSKVIAKLLPGPVTTVLKRKPVLNPDLNPNIESIGIRVIDTEILNSLMTEIGEPLALTSANISGQTSSLCLDDFKEIHSHIDVIIDGGLLETPRDGSTVVDLTVQNTYKIIRKGQQFEETLSILHDFGLTSE